ncbi:MAG: tyrosine--tRNA ligase [Candidatus Aenigmatarchaeota archaeon]
MDLERRIELIKKAPTEEIITEDDLKNLLQTKQKPTAYDGFETSGLLHLGSGILRAIKLQDMLDAKCDFILWIADWFAYINNKMGGNLDLIKKTGEYYIEGWKACGVDIKKVKIMWTSDAVSDPDYWRGVIDIAKNTTVQRTVRACTIMGRKEGEMQYTAQLLYPMMQAWDPFYIKADILQLGMDQRKATILTRELAPKIDGSIRVCVHHHLLAGLQGFEAGRMGKDDLDAKMSKSKPHTAIFIHDSTEEIAEKIKKSYCPEKQIEGNPILEIWKYIIMRKFDYFELKRPQKFGGDVTVESYGKLEKMFVSGDIHPLDLKNATVQALDKIIDPVRKHFEKGKAKELFETVKNAKITR